VFNINGMGRLFINAISTNDYQLVMGITMLLGFLFVLGVIITDISYAYVDPRVTYGERVTMAVSESQYESGREPASEDEESVEARVGWRYTMARIKRDTTARWGLYIVTVVLFVAVYAVVDSNLSRLTFGVASDYTFTACCPSSTTPRTSRRRAGTQHMPPYSRWPSSRGTRFRRAVPSSTRWGPTTPAGTTSPESSTGRRCRCSSGLVSTFIGLTGGTIIGAVAGYYGGRVDDILMRLVETVYAIPPLILIIVFTVFVGGANIWYAVLGVGIAFIPVFARIIRSRVLSIREMDYIEAARAAGVKDRNIIMRHVVPNSFAPVLVYATLQIGVTILIVAGLSLSGVRRTAADPRLGQMLNISHGYMHSNVWLSIWPGIAIMITIMGFNLFGDGLQDALDPRIED